MKEKYTKTRNQMIAARSRNVARLFSGRIYIRSDKFFIVNGNPDPEILFKCLCSVTKVPPFDKEPDPRQLGFSSSDIRPVGNKELNEWSQALLKWQKIAQMMEASKRHKSENKKKLERWRIETEYLGKRRDLLFDLQSEKSLSENTETRWIPSDAEEIHIDKVFAKIAPGKVLPPLWKWLATITWWIGEEAGCLRFLNSLSTVCSTRYKYELEHYIELIHKTFNQFKKDLENDSKQEVFLRVNDLLEKTSIEVLNEIGIKPPRRIRAMEDYFKQQLPHIEKKYNSIKRIDLENVVISSIISALDGSIAALPSRLLTNPIQNKTEFLQTLLDYSISNHYQKLLSILDKIQIEEYSSSVVKNVLNLIIAGADHDDINWIYQQELYGSIISDFSDKRLSPKSLRLIIFVLKDYGEDIYSRSEVEFILGKLISGGSTWFVDVYSEWLIKVPKKYWDKSTARAAWNTMLSGLALSGMEIPGRSSIHLWANPQELKLKLHLPGGFSSETKKSLKYLIHYQKLLGRGEVFPESLTNLLMAGQKKYQELTDLRKLRDDGNLSSGANSRLLKLEAEWTDRTDKISLDQNKIQRKAQETSARSALEALSEIVRRNHIWYFEHEFKSAPPDWLKFHELSDILLWGRQLKHRQKEVFNELFNAWKDFGTDYKTHLSINRDWLIRISKRNENIEKWLYHSEMKCQVSGNQLTIGLTNDPFRIFLMGSYFDTCLGIREGFNRDSVLANAYDANKAVIYAIDEHGVVKARKLLAVNDIGYLVGYNTYINSDDKKERKVIKDKITLFCANLATDTQLKLANTSERIKSLTGVFWYDDGYERWDIKKINKFNIQIAPSDKYPEERIKAFHIQFLAIKNKLAFRDILSRIGLWPQPVGESILKSYRVCPTLIEEALVYVARETRNISLLRDLIDCCQTTSGKFEAQIWDLILTGNKISDNIDFDKSETNRHKFEAALCSADSMSSIQIAFVRSLRTHGNKEVLFPLLWKSKKAATSLIDYLVKEPIWYANSHELFIIIHCLRMHLSGKLPDVLIYNILTHHHSGLTGVMPKEIFSMSQWLPLYRNPNSFLSMKLLINEYNDEEYYREFPEFQLENQVAVIIWAMRNKCPGSMKFLKELSKTVPSALLALSLVTVPYRLHNYITDTALKYIKSPAAILTLLFVHGEGKAEEILHDRGLIENREKEINFRNMVSIFNAYSNLLWKDIGYLILDLNINERIECLPLLLFHVHKALSKSFDGDFGNVRTEEEINGIKNSNIDANGLIFFLTDRLRTCEDKEMQSSLRQFIHKLMKSQFCFPDQTRLWLNIISNDKLYVDLNEKFVKKTLFFGYASRIVKPFDLFFDSNGKRRITADMEWEGDPEDYPTNFPDNLDQAYIYADFLRSKNVKPKFATEMHKRLFDVVSEK